MITNLRRRLIDGTVELLKSSEITQLSIREVARRVGVSHNALYKHFPDKDALLNVVAEEGFAMFRDRLQAEVYNYPDDPLKQLKNSGIAYLKFALENPSYYRLMFGAYHSTPSQIFRKNLLLLIQKQQEESTKSVDLLIPGVLSGEKKIKFNVKEEAFMVLVNIIIRCQKAGLINADNPPVDAPIIQALACWSMVHGLAMLFLDEQISNIEELSVSIVEIVVRGLKTQ
jgi:AcrR family transcriptional regulator